LRIKLQNNRIFGLGSKKTAYHTARHATTRKIGEKHNMIRNAAAPQQHLACAPGFLPSRHAIGRPA